MSSIITQTLWRSLYDGLLYLATPWALLRLYWKSLKLPAYRSRIRERFARLPNNFEESIWVHAVSLGEAVAATPLIRALQKKYPDCPIVITNTTPTGALQIEKSFGKSVFQYYAPYDLPHVVKRFLRQTQPKILILMETEIWPNWIHYCAQNNLPIFIANARLAEQSAQRYQRFRSFFHALFEKITWVGAQSDTDRKHFIDVGVPATRVEVLGNLKFDVALPSDLRETAQQLRATWGDDRLVWVAASTHAGEEEIVLSAFHTLKTHFPNLLLILVPRHPDRFETVFRLAQNTGWNVTRRSQTPTSVSLDTDILLGDSLGELLVFYAASDVAFVGGSFVPVGGHNLLEPAACRLASITGPHLHHIVTMQKLLSEQECTFVVANETALAEKIHSLLSDTRRRETIATKCQKILEENRGACEKHLDRIQTLLTAPKNS